MSYPSKAWFKKYLAPLVGSKIVAVGVNADGFPTITVEKDVDEVGQPGISTKLEISRDEEGNGPGFIFGLPNP